MRLTSNSETLIYKLRIYNSNQKVSNGIWLNNIVLYYIPMGTTGTVSCSFVESVYKIILMEKDEGNIQKAHKTT